MDAELRTILDALIEGQRQLNSRFDALVRDVAGKIDHLAMTMATKADLERFATKADLERFATKADLERFATKADLDKRLREFEDGMDARFAALGAQVTELKEEVADLGVRIRYLTHKTAEIEEDVFVVKRRQKAQ